METCLSNYKKRETKMLFQEGHVYVYDFQM